MECSVNCPHGHLDCELVTLVQGEIEHAARDTQKELARHFHDDHGRKITVCDRCGDSGWVPSWNPFPWLTGTVVSPCSCPAGEQV